MTEQARRHLGCVAILVRDYEEAKAWYTQVLGFALIEDKPLSDGKRWLVAAPSGAAQTRLLLAKAEGADQLSRVGDQAGGRVFLFLDTDDFWRDYESMREHGVRFCEAPRTEAYGTVAVFADLYGNRWDLLQAAHDVAG